MAAMCAACLRPITKQTRFMIVGCEVVHRSCIATLATTGTEGQRTAQRAAELEVRVGVLGATVEEDQRRLRSREKKIGELEQEVSDARRREKSAVDNANAATRGGQRAYQHITDTLTATQADLERALAERDAARREAALHQTIQGRASTTNTDEKAEQPADDRDATSVRYSLLELD